MMIWLGIGLLLAAATIAAPLRWGAAIAVAVVPMSGTAVLILGVDAIILPFVTTLGFLARHAFTLLLRQHREAFIAILKQDAVIVAFVAYGFIAAFFFSRLFAGQAYIVNQDSVIVPLGPHAVSLVQLIYLLLAVWFYLAVRQTILREGLGWLVHAILFQVAAIGGLGFLQAFLGIAGISIDTGWIVNNTAHRLLVGIEAAGFVRVTSVFVEASSFGHWGVGALGFCYALFINRVYTWFSVIMAGAVAFAMLLSTSSTSYVGLLAIGALAVVYALLDPSRARRERGLMVVFLGGAVAAMAAALVFSAEGGFLGELRRMLESATVGKQNSQSAIERGLLADIAVGAGVDTGFLGAGYGVVRASGAFFTMFGSVGLPGIAMFIAFVAPRLLAAFRTPKTAADVIATGGAFGAAGSIATMAVSGSEFGLSSMVWVYMAVAAAPALLKLQTADMKADGKRRRFFFSPSSTP